MDAGFPDHNGEIGSWMNLNYRPVKLKNWRRHPPSSFSYLVSSPGMTLFYVEKLEEIGRWLATTSPQVVSAGSRFLEAGRRTFDGILNRDRKKKVM